MPTFQLPSAVIIRAKKMKKTMIYYFLPTDSIATSVQQKVLTGTVNSISTNTCSPDTFCFTSENTILGK